MTAKNQQGLFSPEASAIAPLAERMRPHRIEDLVGSPTALAESTFLGRMLRGGTIRSLILWGPPGCGKTTIARLLAEQADAEMETLSAVLSGVKDLRDVVARAEQRETREGRGTVLFVDEIHRFNKVQQDAFLPHVETGTLILIGATTENPSFEIIAPLLSRCRVVVLEALSTGDLEKLVDRALGERDKGLGLSNLTIDAEARRFIAESARGDARAALGSLEAAADLTIEADSHVISLEAAEQGVQRKAFLYDKAGEEHYNVISAFIKSMRGSDADAAVYWLARMLAAGEDPLFIARRMVIFASEDVGLADPGALPLAVAVKDAVHFVGLPEARISLAHGATYLALAPKSNASYAALGDASAEVERSGALPVPKHLRNAPTALMRDLGYGRGYVYPHGREQEAAKQSHLPEALAGRRFVKVDTRREEE